MCQGLSGPAYTKSIADSIDSNDIQISTPRSRDKEEGSGVAALCYSVECSRPILLNRKLGNCQMLLSELLRLSEIIFAGLFYLLVSLFTKLRAKAFENVVGIQLNVCVHCHFQFHPLQFWEGCLQCNSSQIR